MVCLVYTLELKSNSSSILSIIERNNYLVEIYGYKRLNWLEKLWGIINIPQFLIILN